MSNSLNPKILILGANGQIGKALSGALNGSIALDWRNKDKGVDLRDRSGLLKTIDIVRPNVIVNAAAYTKVDLAEASEREAFATNFYGVQTLAQVAKEIGAVLVHFSSDYVYDGRLSRPYKETDPTNPLNVYGHSKLEGDRAVTESGCSHLIFRTSWIYSQYGNNFMRTILRLAQSRDNLNVVSDQFGVPTSASLIASTTVRCLQAISVDASLSGVYNLVPKGRTNWFDYASLVIDVARDLGLAVKPAAELLTAVHAEEYETQAERPLNSCLDTKKLQTTFGIELPDWKEDVQKIVMKLVQLP